MEKLRAELAPSAHSPLAELVTKLLDNFELGVERTAHEPLPPVQVPAVVAELLKAGARPVKLFAVCATTFLAVRTLDDFMDGDAPRLLKNAAPAETIVVAHYLHGEAHRMVTELAHTNARPSIGVRYRDMIASMAAGQLEDEAPVSISTKPAAVSRKAEQKSAIMLAEFAAIAAESAGADSSSISSAFALGKHLGLARQYRNDLRDVSVVGSSDLVTRKATMVMALALEASGPEAGRRLLVDLNATDDTGTIADVLGAELLSVVTNRMQERIARHAQAARNHAHQLASGRPADPLIDGLLGAVSL